MSDYYLEVTYRHGKPLAAYYYLPRTSGQRSYRTTQAPQGLVIDFNRGGRAIGIEITAPTRVTVAALNRVLRQLGHPPIKRDDIAPLLAA